MSIHPNVVLVITDDQGYGDLGCNGNPILKTPNIDRFYNDSIHLTNFHVGPTCAPTRSGLLTGHYANSTGVWHTVGGRSLLRKNEITIADALGAAGYRTGIFGKWHLGDNFPYRPQDRGFDDTIIHGGGGISQTPDYWGNDYFNDTFSVNGHPQKFDGYCTDVWFSEAIKFIERNKDRPFFGYIPTNAPHSPFNVENEYSDLYNGKVSEDRANFFGMITNIDENFGKLRDKLKELELEENTILIFMTDNGTACGVSLDESDFVIDGYNAGLRGMKGSEYDGGHRVPFFLRWPAGGLTGARDIDRLTANVDLMPTLLDLCNVEMEKPPKFHGTSINPLLSGESKNWGERTIVTDSQRLAIPIKWRRSSVMTDRWRLINGLELYDLIPDREQRNDVAAEFPEVVEELKEEYEKWWELVSEQFDRDIPISIGSEMEEETRLTCHDWRNDSADCPWHQGHIRQGKEANGYWEIHVEEKGVYSFEFRRWPKEGERNIIDGIEGDDVDWRKDCISDTYASWYTDGKALDLRMAILRIGDQEFSKEIAPKDMGVTFEIELTPGPAHLQTYLTNGRDLNIGSYYVYVRRLIPS